MKDLGHGEDLKLCFATVAGISGKLQDKLVMPYVLLQKVAEHLQQRPELLPTLLTTLFEIVLFEDCPNQWSLSRPMLSLILINEQVSP